MREQYNPLREEKDVVMLPTNEVINPGGHLYSEDNRLWYRHLHKGFQNTIERKLQHIYVLSNEEIKEGDWFIWQSQSSGTVEMHQMHSDAGYGIKTHTQYNEADGSSVIVNWSGLRGKVIATDDPKLHYKSEGYVHAIPNVAKLSTDFLQAFIRHYNESKPIEKILVEYKYQGQPCELCGKTDCEESPQIEVLNLRPDGTIIIHPVKERMFTFEQLKEAFNAARSKGKVGVPYSYDEDTYDTAEDYLNSKIS